MFNKIKVLLVDDQNLFVESLKFVIESKADDFEVIGIAYNGKEAISFVEIETPDLILMDIRMPALDGVHAAKIIHEKYPRITIIMLTTFDDDEYVKEALRFGAVGYLLKDIEPPELIAALRSVAHSGSVMISPKIAAKIFDSEKKREETNANLNYLVSSLTNRETEILHLMSIGYDNHEIAEDLGIAEQTVKNHITVIYDKLGVRDRVNAINYFKNNQKKY